jgi:hypothetical protein
VEGKKRVEEVGKEGEENARDEAEREEGRRTDTWERRGKKRNGEV